MNSGVCVSSEGNRSRSILLKWWRIHLYVGQNTAKTLIGKGFQMACVLILANRSIYLVRFLTPPFYQKQQNRNHLRTKMNCTKKSATIPTTDATNRILGVEKNNPLIDQIGAGSCMENDRITFLPPTPYTLSLSKKNVVLYLIFLSIQQKWLKINKIRTK